MNQRTKLELVWPGKENRKRPEPRILIEDKALSYRAATPEAEQAQGELLDEDGAASVASATPTFDNLLVHGDNLLALKALESHYSGRVKCIFIDPPYNTGSAFAHYDDGVEHSMWLTLMRDRLEILRTLLSEDGSIWITVDDNEAHYLRVLGDEIFGRSCFIADVAWQKRDGPPNDRKIGSIHDHLLVWGKRKIVTGKKTVAEEAFNLMPRTDKADAQYQVFAEPGGRDARGAFRKIDTTANGKGGRYVESLYYPVTNPFTREDVWPREGTCWRHSRAEMERLQADGRLFWGAKGTAKTPMRKLYKSEAKQGMTAPSIWSDAGLNQHASAHMEALFGEKAAFETPKPEELLYRAIHIASNPGDVVLDSFAGSGTTGAVAQKMGRRWIMVELGEHCRTHIVPRMKKVIDGQDPGGITKLASWQGGGGYRFLRLAPSLLKKDTWGNWVINAAYNPEMLAEAMCKHMGFQYAPSSEHFWMHGHSTETDFIYVTTGSLSRDQLRAISEAVGSERTLMICCKAFMADAKSFPNLTLKKIPKSVLGKCQWDHDDYSFNIDVLAPPEPEEAMDDDDQVDE